MGTVRVPASLLEDGLPRALPLRVTPLRAQCLPPWGGVVPHRHVHPQLILMDNLKWHLILHICTRKWILQVGFKWIYFQHLARFDSMFNNLDENLPLE